MESIVRDIVMDNFLSSDFFSDNQYGFIKGRSTVIQLLKIMDEWPYNLDQGIQILRFFGMYPAMGVALYRRGAMDNLAR